jgi:tricorn protease
LFFLSNRQFAPQISSIEWNFAGNRNIGIFGLALRKDVKNLFPPQNDEVTVATPSEQLKQTGEQKQPNKEKKSEDEKQPAAQGMPESSKKPVAASVDKPATKIDFDGLASRVVRVPIEADNLDGLVAVNGHLLYSLSGAEFHGRKSAEKVKLQVFDLAKREASTLAEDVDEFAVSADGSKVLVRGESGFNLMDVKPKVTDKKAVSTKDLMVDRIPAEEWAEIFEEVWRRYRDFFYVRNMHGYDWKAIGAQYRAQLPYVGHRSDLTYVLSEMVSELNAGHCYIQGGDFEIPARPSVGLPGARFELDAKAGRYRITKIFPGNNEEEKYRSPLTEVGMDISVGDYALAIDGEELRPTDDPYRLLRHKKQLVTLTINKIPVFEGARKVSYHPITTEAPLLYLDWVRNNREKVAAASNGRVGYVHIPDMGANGIYEFIKWYYPQIRKEGLVIDVRANGGGNVSQWIIERLDSKLLGTRFGSMSDDPGTYPSTVFHGHMVCLINETSGSDGDIFPYRFRQSGLGLLIGKRTWGGVVGIDDLGPLLDGGQVLVPLTATNSPTGEYIIEGHGVDPDIEIENTPKEVIAGGDPQLERGIQEVLKRIKSDPKRMPSRPPDPVKTP